MNLSKELHNGIMIFIGIGMYFLLMELLGLSDVFILRLLNILIVIYYVNKTIKSNYTEGKLEYLDNLISGTLTSLIGGDAYLVNLSQNFLFGGGNPSMYQFCIGLLFEGIASSVIITFTLMQYWKDRSLKHF